MTMTATVPSPPLNLTSLPVRTPDLGELTPDERTLLCVADALVLKVLEKAGKRILKEKRERHTLHRGKPMWTAHTSWPVDEGTARKITRGEWLAFVQVLDSPDLNQMEQVLDNYTVGILSQGTPHTPLDLWLFILGQTTQPHLGDEYAL